MAARDVMASVGSVLDLDVTTTITIITITTNTITITINTTHSQVVILCVRLDAFCAVLVCGELLSWPRGWPLDSPTG